MPVQIPCGRLVLRSAFFQRDLQRKFGALSCDSERIPAPWGIFDPNLTFTVYGEVSYDFFVVADDADAQVAGGHGGYCVPNERFAVCSDAGGRSVGLQYAGQLADADFCFSADCRCDGRNSKMGSALADVLFGDDAEREILRAVGVFNRQTGMTAADKKDE